MTSSETRVSPDRLRTLWRRLLKELSKRGFVSPASATPSMAPPDWRAFSNEQIFKAFAIALISGNTRWDRVAAAVEDMRVPFQSFDLRAFAALSDDALETNVLPCFRQRKLGSISLRAGLAGLRETARKLSAGGTAQSASDYLAAAAACADDKADDLAALLATSKIWKLPGFGVALAAEALRNLGLDLAKPDRHILRALGSWSLIAFKHWDRHGDFTPPQATPSELRRAMAIVRAIAEANALSVSATNSVIWNAGAVSGVRLTNGDFERMAA